MASNIHSHQHLMGPALMAGEPTLKMEFPHLRFSTATTAFMLALALPVTLISCFTTWWWFKYANLQRSQGVYATLFADDAILCQIPLTIY